MEPHVCKISRQGTDGRGEWVSIVNAGATAVALTGLVLTDYTKTQQHVHLIRFPATATRSALLLGPREHAFVFSGKGQNTWNTPASGRRELWLFAGRAAPIWNNDGDVAYLRRVDGTFVDSLTFGAPTRHPQGH